MKALLTFTAAFLFVIATWASDRYPAVTIKSKKQFEIMVDGRRYVNDKNIRLDRLNRGMHTIKVYERNRGLFGRSRLVASRNFFVWNQDIRITIDHFGYVNIDEAGNRWDKDRRWNDNNKYNDRDDRGYNRNRGF
jgi:hypothetical protein